MVWSIACKYIYTKEEIRMVNILSIAYIGDCIYELYCRNIVTKRYGDIDSKKLHLETIKYVNAIFQSNAYFRIRGLLNEEENYYFKRGRNTTIKTFPKNCSIRDYKNATGLESVIGYLYMTGNFERVDFILDTIFGFI